MENYRSFPRFNAALSVAEVFFGNQESNLQQLRDGEITEVVMNSRRMVEQSPYVVDFYLTWRRQNAGISKILSQVEQRYFGKLKKIFPSLDIDSLKAIYATFFGLVTNPAISDEAIRIACEHIKQQFQQQES